MLKPSLLPPSLYAQVFRAPSFKGHCPAHENTPEALVSQLITIALCMTKSFLFPECEIANLNSARKRSTREPPRRARRRALTCYFLSGARGGNPSLPTYFCCKATKKYVSFEATNFCLNQWRKSFVRFPHLSLYIQRPVRNRSLDILCPGWESNPHGLAATKF